VLTSGGLGNAFDNIDVLKQMIKLADNQINIIVAGGITNKNLPKLHRRIQANEYHGKRIVGKV
jgi:copper homeostasis protein